MRLGIIVDISTSAIAFSAEVEMQDGVSCLPEAGEISFARLLLGGACDSQEKWLLWDRGEG